MFEWLREFIEAWRLDTARGRGQAAVTEPEPKERKPLPESIKPAGRKSWRPIVADESGARVSRFGGSEACFAAGESWPTCPNCSRKLNLFLQISSQELPAEAGHPFGEGILQLFYCISAEPLCEGDTEAWAPFSASVVVRIVAHDTPLRAGQNERSFPMRQISGWKGEIDYPSWEETEVDLVLSDEDEDLVAEHGFPRAGDKLLGWPAWVQGPEYPNCFECGERMHVIFQIDSEDNIPYMFGDLGCGHVSQCRNHPEVLAFAWACS